jgi:gliding motility-associated-like protein
MGQNLCEGSLGANLFEDGDFGSGTSNNQLVDPEIAPGFEYVTSGPPFDGQYILTQNMGAWSNLFGTWLPLRESSADPDGYMMVVNASFEPGLFYEEEITGICENTQFEFSADLINVIRRGVTDHIEPNVAFLIDDVVVLQTGNLPQNERWETFAFTFTTQPGQSSVMLSLRNNAPGGIGNDLALDNIRFRACGPPSRITSNAIDSIFCQEDSPLLLTAELESNQNLDDPFFQWEELESNEWIPIMGANDRMLSVDNLPEGTHNYRLSFAGSEANFDNEQCRFFSEFITITAPQRNFEIMDTICGGTGLDITGLTITEPGVFVEELVSRFGCDSIITYFIDTIARATITADIVPSDPICFGAATGTIAANDISNGFPPYFIEVGGQEFSGTLANELLAKKHVVRVVDRFGCFLEDEITLNDPEEFLASIGPDRDIFLGEEVEIDIISNELIANTTVVAAPLGLVDTSNLTFLPFEDSELIILARSEANCLAQDTLNIRVDQDLRIYTPTAFSPNNDGVNDHYTVSAIGRSIEFIEHLNIYSKWGELLYTARELNEGWNGLAPNGEQSEQGVYVFHLKGTLINGAPIDEVGTFQLIR